MKEKINFKNHDGKEILKWNDWARPAEPIKHWRSGRSAMELARSWFTCSEIKIPEEFVSLLNSHELTRDLKIISGTPELKIPLPGSDSGDRQQDLVLRGKVDQKKITISVEAKADEPFDNKLTANYYSQKFGTKSKVPERILALSEIVFRDKLEMKPKLPSKIGRHPYQLLTGFAGTVLQAVKDESEFGIFVIHEFHTDRTKKEKIKVNDKAYNNFIRDLFNDKKKETNTGQLYGPIPSSFAAQNIVDYPILIGKAVIDWNI